ncbi:MAG: thiamine-phosphate kinase [Proteobacteria bacterium]|nr:thiamine-phosphate kinase [Pseudomonadota bacterium]
MSRKSPVRPGEFELIARYLAPMAGPGALGLTDDAAVLTPPPGSDLVLSKDALVAGVHFFADDPPALIGRKALRVNLSDLAAKGARPLGFLLGLGLPRGWREDWIAGLADGLAADSAEFACPLLGGDTVAAGSRAMLSVTVLGAVPAGSMARRSGGKPGDALYVSGTIGDGALGLLARMAEREGRAVAADAPLVLRYLVPEPRMALAQVVRNHASAAMDVSDGLMGDAEKLAAASGCGLALQLSDVPLSPRSRAWIAADPDNLRRAVTGGDDYEILAAVPPERATAFEVAAQVAGISVTRIGALTESGKQILGPNATPVHWRDASFRHF